MFKSIALSASSIGVCITGCAVLPEYREEAVTTAEIIRHIKCELRDAAYGYPQNEWVRDWTAGLIFTFKVDHTGGLDADAASWRFPINGGANFTISLTGGFSGQGVRTENMNFKVAMKELDKEISEGHFDCYDHDRDPSRFARLGGRLGIADLFERTYHTMNVAHVPVKVMNSLDYNIDYVVRLEGSAQPRFNLVPIGKEKVFTGSMNWTGKRSDTQSLKITLTPPTPEKACPVVAGDGTPFKKCPDVVALLPYAKPACSILRVEQDCKSQNHCSWDGSQCVPAAPAKTTAFIDATQEWRPTRVAPEALSESDVRRNDAAQLQNLILESGLLDE